MREGCTMGMVRTYGVHLLVDIQFVKWPYYTLYVLWGGATFRRRGEHAKLQQRGRKRRREHRHGVHGRVLHSWYISVAFKVLETQCRRILSQHAHKITHMNARRQTVAIPMDTTDILGVPWLIGLTNTKQEYCRFLAYLPCNPFHFKTKNIKRQEVESGVVMASVKFVPSTCLPFSTG